MSCSQKNCEAAFGVDFHGIRELIDRAFKNPMEPELDENASIQTIVDNEEMTAGGLHRFHEVVQIS